MATHTPTHAGLERVIDGASAASSVFSDIFSAKHLPTYVLAVTVMAVVTLAERAMDAVETGFALEWAILSVVSLLTFGLFARAIVRATRSTQAWFMDYAKHYRQTQADIKLWETARRDPRIMSEIMVAQGRDSHDFDEALAPLGGNSVRNDPLRSSVPWAQLTRYY